MTNIELKNSFEDYAVNELVTKLHELEPSDYDIDNVQNYDDLLYLLLEDEYDNHCYYIYTDDNNAVFGKYFKDILYICNSFGYKDGLPIDLETGNLLLIAMERAFKTLLERAATPHTTFTRGGLDKLAKSVLNIDNAKLQDIIYFD